MTFRRGQRVEVYQSSRDERWEDYMDRFVGRRGVVVDPDTSKNDPDDLIEVSLDGLGTHRVPQDCLRVVEE